MDIMGVEDYEYQKEPVESLAEKENREFQTMSTVLGYSRLAKAQSIRQKRQLRNNSITGNLAGQRSYKAHKKCC